MYSCKYYLFNSYNTDYFFWKKRFSSLKFILSVAISHISTPLQAGNRGWRKKQGLREDGCFWMRNNHVTYCVMVHVKVLQISLVHESSYLHLLCFTMFSHSAILVSCSNYVQYLKGIRPEIVS